MKKLLIFVFSLQLLVVFTGCTKDKDRQTLLENTWEVEYIISEGTVMRPCDFYKPPSVPVPGFFWFNLLLDITYSVPNQLLFSTNERFTFALETNIVNGVVKVGGNKIDFKIESGEQPSENQFTKTCIHLLENVTQYEKGTYNFILRGNKGEIYLKVLN